MADRHASSLKPKREAGSADLYAFALRTLIPFAGVIVALALSALVLVILKANPVEAYGAMFRGAFGSVNGLSQSLVKATPLLLVGLGVCIAFRASVINVGGEGQIILGALAGTWLALTFPDVPRFLLVPSCMIAGFIAGAFWGFIPGLLKARFNVNEILSTIMMNSIALQFMNYLLQGPMMDPEGIKAGTFLAQ